MTMAMAYICGIKRTMEESVEQGSETHQSKRKSVLSNVFIQEEERIDNLVKYFTFS